jgi:hypothetical protein
MMRPPQVISVGIDSKMNLCVKKIASLMLDLVSFGSKKSVLLGYEAQKL